MGRAFIRSGVPPGWPIERQREAVLAAGARPVSVYADELSQAKAAKRDPALPSARADLLRPTGRAADATVHVTRLRAFVLSVPDFLPSIGLLFARHDALHVCDSDLTLKPVEGIGEIATAAAALAGELRQAQTAAARKRATETARPRITAEERKRRAAAFADWCAVDSDAG
jgi:hypothetical protein